LFVRDVYVGFVTRVTFDVTVAVRFVTLLLFVVAPLNVTLLLLLRCVVDVYVYVITDICYVYFVCGLFPVRVVVAIYVVCCYVVCCCSLLLPILFG